MKNKTSQTPFQHASVKQNDDAVAKAAAEARMEKAAQRLVDKSAANPAATPNYLLMLS